MPGYSTYIAVPFACSCSFPCMFYGFFPLLPHVPAQRSCDEQSLALLLFLTLPHPPFPLYLPHDVLLCCSHHPLIHYKAFLVNLFIIYHHPLECKLHEGGCFLSVLFTPVFPAPTIYLSHPGCSRSICWMNIEPYTWELLGWRDSLQHSPELLCDGIAVGGPRMKLWSCHSVQVDDTCFILISPSPILGLPQT